MNENADIRTHASTRPSGRGCWRILTPFSVINNDLSRRPPTSRCTTQPAAPPPAAIGHITGQGTWGDHLWGHYILRPLHLQTTPLPAFP